MLNWYLNRLRSFNFSEIIFRINQLISLLIEKYFLKNLVPNHETVRTTRNILQITDIKFTFLKSNFVYFGGSFDYSKKKINWQKDISNHKEFSIKFSKSINIRKDPELSAKNVWEINRLQFLPIIAINYQSTNNQKYLDQFTEIIESWDLNNPYMMGINWYSNIEVNIRLISWFLSWEILHVEKIIEKNTRFKDFVNSTWIPLIYKHCKYSYANPSKYSSANNHLIAEYSGLFIASSKWQFEESEQWKNYSKKGLEKEIENQHSNGVNKEQAAEYIQFVTDFFLISFIIGENTQNSFSKKYQNTLKEIFDYIYNLTDKDGNFPQYGDEDDGKVILLSDEQNFNNFKSLMTSAAILFKNTKYKSKCCGLDLKNKFLFGEEGEKKFNEIPTKFDSQNSKFYTAEGHFIFRKQNKEKEIYMHFNAAPLGYLSIAAHGHADALSFILHVNGWPIFIDSGTYSYHVAKEWREYFVSTMAHNTVCIDNQNQAHHAGDTMWLNHYTTKILNVQQTEENESVTATHSGYKNCSHTRKIEFSKEYDCFTLTDYLTVHKKKHHEIYILFHLHPKVKIQKFASNQVILTLNSIKIELHIEGIENEIEHSNGQYNPILGWYSESFLKKEPTTTLFIKKSINTSQIFKTSIKLIRY